MTLLEIMVVTFIIGIIASVVGFNMKGSIDKGRAFKTEHGMRQAQEILMFMVAEGKVNASELKGNLQQAINTLRESKLVRDPEKLLKDGWNQNYSIDVNSEGEVVLTSTFYEEYKRLNG